jgi:hypothetical protein
MTIQQQYNTELDRIFWDCRNINSQLVEQIYKQYSKNWAGWSIEEPHIKYLVIAGILTAKDENGKFLFEAGQKEIKIELSRVRGGAFDFAVVNKNITISNLFLSNSLLTGVDEEDQEKIENLKKIKFV